MFLHCDSRSKDVQSLLLPTFLYLLYLLYHTLSHLSRVFPNFFKNFCGVRGGSRTLGNYPSPALALTYKVLLGLFTTGSASLSYLTEALVHIYIPQPRGDLAVRCLCREGLTHSRGCCPFFRVAFPRLCVLIIAHFVKFVKGFSTFSRNFFFERPYARATLTMASIRLRRPSPLDILIIAHSVLFVKRFFKFL